MPFTLNVVPPLLSAAGLRQQMAGRRLNSIAAALEAAGGEASAAAGDPALAGTLGELSSSGAGAIRSAAVSVGAMGTNLGVASDAYLAADLSSMPGG